MIHLNFSIHWGVILGFFIGIAILDVYIIWRFIRPSHKKDPYVGKQWREIDELVQLGKIPSFKMGIIEADKLMDYIFKKMHFSGKDFAERLRGACHKYPFLKELWFPHNLRNDIVHQSHFELSKWEAKKAIKIYRRTLKRLGYLK